MAFLLVEDNKRQIRTWWLCEGDQISPRGAEVTAVLDVDGLPSLSFPFHPHTLPNSGTSVLSGDLPTDYTKAHSRATYKPSGTFEWPSHRATPRTGFHCLSTYLPYFCILAPSLCWAGVPVLLTHPKTKSKGAKWVSAPFHTICCSISRPTWICGMYTLYTW